MNYKRINWVSLTFFILILILAVVILSIAISGKNKSSVSKPPQSSLVTPISLISNLGSKLAQQFGETAVTRPAAPLQPLPGYLIPGDGYKVTLPTSNSLKLQLSSTEIPEAENTVNGFLGSRKFTKAEVSQSALSVNDTFYTNNSIICQEVNTTSLYILCVELSQLKQIATQAKPFVALYESSSSNQSLSVMSLTEQASATPGYRVAYANFLTNAGQVKAYYYKSPSQDWQIVNLNWFNDPHENGDVIPNCGYFSSVNAIRLAFRGITCYDSAARSSSKLD